MDYQNISLFVIGTELTKGIITDSHIKLMTSELTNIGYNILSATLLPDDGSILNSLKNCLDSSDIIIVTGGLGPTSDDITRNIIASLAGVNLTENQIELEKLKEKVGSNLNSANIRQIMIPEGFNPIKNENGTAPGFFGNIKKKERDIICVALPGPPKELQPMFYQSVLPYFKTLSGHNSDQRDEYSVFLIPEARLEECCKKYDSKNVLWATRFQSTKISLYLTGGTQDDRNNLINNLKKDFGEGIIVPGNFEAVDCLVETLKTKHFSVCTAESCTGGLLSKILTDKSGSSSWFWGGAATYSNDAKSKILKVDDDVLTNYGAVSKECAMQMADGIRNLSNSDLSISTTGFAGPTGGTEVDPIGTVWFGFSSSFRETAAVKIQFSIKSRDAIRRRASVAALILGNLYIAGVCILDIANSWQYT